MIRSRKDFPLERSCDDTLSSAFDQAMKIDGQMMCTDITLTFSHFVFIRDRLYRDTTTQKEHTQLCQKSAGKLFSSWLIIT